MKFIPVSKLDSSQRNSTSFKKVDSSCNSNSPQTWNVDVFRIGSPFQNQTRCRPGCDYCWQYYLFRSEAKVSFNKASISSVTDLFTRLRAVSLNMMGSQNSDTEWREMWPWHIYGPRCHTHARACTLYRDAWHPPRGAALWCVVTPVTV